MLSIILLCFYSLTTASRGKLKPWVRSASGAFLQQHRSSASGIRKSMLASDFSQCRLQSVPPFLRFLFYTSYVLKKKKLKKKHRNAYSTTSNSKFSNWISIEQQMIRFICEILNICPFRCHPLWDVSFKDYIFNMWHYSLLGCISDTAWVSSSSNKSI